MKNKKFFLKVLAALLAPLALSGCFLFYFPLLMLAPFQPFIMIAAKVAARYGPLLLLLVETNQPLPNQAPTMIAMQPAAITEETKLSSLEDQIVFEANNNKNLKAIIVVETDKITPEWLAEQIRIAYNNKASLRAVFVNSKDVKTISFQTVAKLKNKKINLCVTEGAAEKIIPENVCVQKIPFYNIKLPCGEQAALACLMSACQPPN